MSYLYETHTHTSPASRCGKVSVRETLEYYKRVGYSGVFITNHFVDGNIGCDRSLPYSDMINFYFADYEEGKRLESEIGISVFCGVESSYKGTDFLIYGLSREWYLAHPELADLKKSEMLPLLMSAGALVVQAHPFREARYIDHIRLFPRHVQGVEVYNACRTELENNMASILADRYGLLRFSGSDNHVGEGQRTLGGMCFDSPILSEADFVTRVLSGKGTPFRCEVSDSSDTLDKIALL